MLVDLAALAVIAAGPFEVRRWQQLALCGGIVACGLVAAELAREVERRRRWFAGVPHINFSSVWTLAGALVLPPALAGLVAAALYGHLWLRCTAHLPGMRLSRMVFNASNVVLSCQVAAWATEATGLWPFALDRGAAMLACLLLVVMLYYATNSAIAAITVALVSTERSFVLLMGPLHENMLELATLCIGAIAGLIFETVPPLIVLLFLPLYALHKSALMRQLEHAATMDTKTGMLNSSNWHAVANAELKRARRDGTELGILMIDLDYFSRVNDTLGHQAGDDALSAVARQIRKTVPRDDLCGRFGGEEFVVVLPCCDAERTREIAERVCRAVADLDVVATAANTVFSVTVSIGAATYPGRGTELSDLLFAADLALYASKDAGRNRVSMLDPS
ncbi:GGDEF domain-containing protein [Amycolatopsis sp. CA-230715]|uniref:GGDEF domain-containing protein n=1 Tax=Amycolatopsis sp. CA-230715 TaxID=2745196 RepID=UPI001C039978|nr:GGDEF domain-containing protein [Amycolatopsis sp. CA-230715]QWF80997.1 hypothetical protein HUW46_04422 [Amycolatopsis sp. CA-230715]